jgi:hypothetical protein
VLGHNTLIEMKIIRIVRRLGTIVSGRFVKAVSVIVIVFKSYWKA